MKSTWGRRGVMMEKFGWSWEYINWRVPFVVTQRIMADMPWYDYKSEKGPSPKGGQQISNTKLTSNNIDDVIAQFNSIPR